MSHRSNEGYEEYHPRFPEQNMRKQELVHLHGLFVKITQSLVEQGTVSAEIWNDYEALEINAYSIQAPKSAHEEAVLFLATTLRSTLDQVTEEQSAISIR